MVCDDVDIENRLITELTDSIQDILSTYRSNDPEPLIRYPHCSAS